MKTRLPMALLACLLATAAWAGDLKVENAWARATAPGQNVAGAFMDITASRDLNLVGGETPAAKLVELHTMRMEDGVMIMRRMPVIKLPAGKTVSLKPGGLHVMLIDLNGPLTAGEKTPVTLIAKDKRGKEQRLTVEVEARAPDGMGHAHH